MDWVAKNATRHRRSPREPRRDLHAVPCDTAVKCRDRQGRDAGRRRRATTACRPCYFSPVVGRRRADRRGHDAHGRPGSFSDYGGCAASPPASTSRRRGSAEGRTPLGNLDGVAARRRHRRAGAADESHSESCDGRDDDQGGCRAQQGERSEAPNLVARGIRLDRRRDRRRTRCRFVSSTSAAIACDVCDAVEDPEWIVSSLRPATHRLHDVDASA